FYCLFGTSRSKVQILSPRPLPSHSLTHVTCLPLLRISGQLHLNPPYDQLPHRTPAAIVGRDHRATLASSTWRSQFCAKPVARKFLRPSISTLEPPSPKRAKPFPNALLQTLCR